MKKIWSVFLEVMAQGLRDISRQLGISKEREVVVEAKRKADLLAERRRREEHGAA